jgi:hypothetical protein
VIDLEIAALDAWACDVVSRKEEEEEGDVKLDDGLCQAHVRISGRCFTGCPFIVSHSSVSESMHLGYTFPEAIHRFSPAV